MPTKQNLETESFGHCSVVATRGNLSFDTVLYNTKL